MTNSWADFFQMGLVGPSLRGVKVRKMNEIIVQQIISLAKIHLNNHIMMMMNKRFLLVLVEYVNVKYEAGA